MTLTERANDINEAFSNWYDANEIADDLYSNGIRGLRCDADYCPIVNFLVWKGFVSESAQVHADVIEDDGESLDLPETVQSFIRMFDRKQYPFLIYGWWDRLRIAWRNFRNTMVA